MPKRLCKILKTQFILKFFGNLSLYKIFKEDIRFIDVSQYQL